jgi:putative redox protein
MNVNVEWSDRLSFTGTAQTGFVVPLGASPDVGGDNDGFRPMELMALSLAGCTAMDVISILSKKRQNVTNFAVEVEATQAEDHPRIFTSAKIIYRFRGNEIDPVAVERAIELSKDKYCPAQGMLGQIMPIEILYEIEEG